MMCFREEEHWTRLWLLQKRIKNVNVSVMLCCLFVCEAYDCAVWLRLQVNDEHY